MSVFTNNLRTKVNISTTLKQGSERKQFVNSAARFWSSIAADGERTEAPDETHKVQNFSFKCKGFVVC